MATLQLIYGPQSDALLYRHVHPWVAFIVVVGLGLLLSTFSLKHLECSHSVQTAMLYTNLHQLRDTIARFHQDTGHYPARLSDLVARDEHQLRTPVQQGSYRGPYLSKTGGINGTGIPINPFAQLTGKDQSIEAVINHNWRYSASTGKVRSADSAMILAGRPSQSL